MRKEFLFLLLALTFSCSKKNTKSNDKSIIPGNLDTLKYAYRGFNDGLQLDLLSDGCFIYEYHFFGCLGGGKVLKVFGAHEKDSLKLILNPESVELILYPQDMEKEPITSKMKYGIGSFKIKTEFQSVYWENNEYLLSEQFDFGWWLEEENDYIRFAGYFNQGLEPKSNGMYLVRKFNDSMRSEFDVKQLPEKWQPYFFKEPVIARVKHIRKIVNPYHKEYFNWQIELDKGASDKIYKMLMMKTKDGAFRIEIDSVLKNSSFGMVYRHDFTPEMLPIGTEFRSQWN
ncbi:MAG: hypothetical protein ACOVNZ_09005 [Crocinitomicaceae bacterium]|jgi:hypothetical protein